MTVISSLWTALILSTTWLPHSPPSTAAAFLLQPEAARGARRVPPPEAEPPTAAPKPASGRPGKEDGWEPYRYEGPTPWSESFPAPTAFAVLYLLAWAILLASLATLASRQSGMVRGITSLRDELLQRAQDAAAAPSRDARRPDRG